MTETTTETLKKRTRAKKPPTPAVEEAVDRQYEVSAKKPKRGKLAALAPSLPKPPVISDRALAKAQLRRLVNEYEVLGQEVKAAKQRTCDYVDTETGEVHPCPLSEEQKARMLGVADALDKARHSLEPDMLRIMRTFPVYAEFLEKVRGIGVGTAAKLLAHVDISRARTASSLRQFCGLGFDQIDVKPGEMVDDEGVPLSELRFAGQRMRAGLKRSYNMNVKTALFIAQGCLQRDPKRAESPYWRFGEHYSHRLLTSPRYNRAENTFDGRKGGRAIVNGANTAKGTLPGMRWKKIMSLFLEHLYVVWRAAEGLPVWPTYDTAKRGHAHGGAPVLNAPTMMSLEEALAAVHASWGAQMQMPVPERVVPGADPEPESPVAEAAQ